MIYETEMTALENRASAARVTMSYVCKRAGKHRQSWFRARKRGSANYTLIDPLWDAIIQIEREHNARQANPT